LNSELLISKLRSGIYSLGIPSLMTIQEKGSQNNEGMNLFGLFVLENIQTAKKKMHLDEAKIFMLYLIFSEILGRNVKNH
jgi:hypothetical protein